jgi:hypothetical protein
VEQLIEIKITMRCLTETLSPKGRSSDSEESVGLFETLRGSFEWINRRGKRYNQLIKGR